MCLPAVIKLKRENNHSILFSPVTLLTDRSVLPCMLPCSGSGAHAVPALLRAVGTPPLAKLLPDCLPDPDLQSSAPPQHKTHPQLLHAAAAAAVLGCWLQLRLLQLPSGCGQECHGCVCCSAIV